MQDYLLDLDTKSRNEVLEIAQTLAKFGLGISVPHMHSANKARVALPDNLVALEDDLQVRFLDRSQIPDNSEPVGWRWADGHMAVYAYCCGNDDPPW